MSRRIWFGIFVAVALVLGAIGIGSIAYQAGMAQGLAQGIASDGGTAAQGIARGYFWPYPFFGFGLFPILGLLVFVFLVFGAVRGLFWFGFMRRRAFRGGMGHWDSDMTNQDGVPPMVQEWHRRMHTTGRDQPGKTETPQP